MIFWEASEYFRGLVLVLVDTLGSTEDPSESWEHNLSGFLFPSSHLLCGFSIVSFCNPGCPGAHCVDCDGKASETCSVLTYTDLPAPAS